MSAFPPKADIRGQHYPRRQLVANATIAASRLARIHG